jgi:hypothetical protein
MSKIKYFLFKCYWYDTTEKGIRVDPHHGLAKINSKAKLCNVDNVFIFAKQCQQVYYTHNLFFRKDRSRVNWLSILKTKPMSRVKVVQDENDEPNMRDDVFEVSELVDPYRVLLSIDLEEIQIFTSLRIFLLMLTVLNIVLSSSGQTQVNEDDDNNEINV